LVPSAFVAITFALFLAAFVAFYAIVVDVLPYLPREHRFHLSGSVGNRRSDWRGWRNAVNAAWRTHYQQFPNSVKRSLVGALLILASLSFFFYPVWLALKKGR
jgi:hypothetical protein